MKFKYNDKTYVVFATEEEIDSNYLLIKVDEEYLDYNKFHGCWDKPNTTEVLKLINKGSKILQSYELKTKDVIVDTLYAESLSGTLYDAVGLLSRLGNNYPDARITLVSNCGKEYYVITICIEETEEEAKTRLGCNWNKVKYYEP